MVNVAEVIQDLNLKYEKVHLEFENNFWATKMDLKGNSAEELARTKNEYEAFLGDAANLQRVRAALAEGPEPEQARVLRIMEKTFLCYITEDPRAVALKEKLNELEAELAADRNKMQLGYVTPGTGEFVKGSSVALRNTMRTNADEATRKACYEGMRTIGPFVAEKFCEIVKLRNKLARLTGAEDYYDMKVKSAEGFSKRALFEMLEPLASQSRPLNEAALAGLAKDKGEAARLPWNRGFLLSGDVEREMDPYFPFEDAVDVWARTFAGLGIRYGGATMTLDLCDREGKYSNGFCHWVQPAWRKPDGAWVPSVANFTSLAIPSAVGSGKTALTTLLHEGGHAAHFANIDQPSPLFSQERAPTSVAYAENQSMFLDSLAGDAAWLGRYARNREGATVPWELLEKSIRATAPYGVFMVRGMLSVPFFEKALYELPEERVTPEEVIALADRIEREVEGGPSPRPLLSVPHILADEASAYYHGYVLAEMSVHQTRGHFLAKYGGIVDRPQIGADLQQVYWRPGNGAAFLDLVKQLTGAPLSADAWVSELKKGTEERLRDEKREYEAAVAAGPAIPPGQEPDLGMTVRLVHGDEVIADSREAGGVQAACNVFKQWVRKAYF